MSIRLTVDAMPILAGGGGISNYICPLVRAFLAHAGGAPEIRTTLHWRVHGRDRLRRATGLIASGMPEYPGVAHRLTRLPDRMLDWCWRRSLPGLNRLTLPPTDVYFATTPILPAFGPFARVTVVHDVTPAIIPEYFPGSRDAFIARTRQYCLACDAILAVSKNTARDIVEVCGIDPQRIRVAYPGLPDPLGDEQEDPAVLSRLHVQKPYIVYLGALAHNKNIEGLLRSFGAFQRLGYRHWSLVATGRDFVGKQHWERICREEGIADRVVFTGWVTDVERWTLLRQAELLLHLSWYEGFGLPVLEAIRLGKPALISDRGPFPEIVPNPEQLVDPADPAAVAKRLAEFAESPELRERWAEFMRRRARGFSWERSGKLLARVVRETAPRSR